MSDIKIKYTGDLRTTATHVSSGSKIITDAPLDNKEKEKSFLLQIYLLQLLGHAC